MIFSFDIGSRTIGSAVTPHAINGQADRAAWAGVTLFGQSKRIRAQIIRDIRTRKRRENKKQRLLDIRQWLETRDLIPPYEDKAARNAYFALKPATLIEAAKNRRLMPHEIGRIFYYLAAHRGRNMCRDFTSQINCFRILAANQNNFSHIKLGYSLKQVENKLFGRHQEPSSQLLLDQAQPLAQLVQLLERIQKIRVLDPNSQSTQCLTHAQQQYIWRDLILGKTLSAAHIAQQCHIPAHYVHLPDGADQLAPAPLTKLLIKPGFFGHHWHSLSFEIQDALICALLAKDRSALERHWPDTVPLSSDRIDRLLRLHLKPQKTSFTQLQTKQKLHQLLSQSLPQECSDSQKASLFDKIFRHQFKAMEMAFGAPDKIIIEWPDTAHNAIKAPKGRLIDLFNAHYDVRIKGVLCPYTGAVLTRQMCQENAVEIDHIIPKSRGGDTTAHNLVLCCAEANQRKGGRTPFEAFGNTPLWPLMKARIAAWPQPKQQRFLCTTGGKAFIKQTNQHSLDQTKHFTRSALAWLTTENPEIEVQLISSRMVHHHRQKRNLAKDRNDLTNHALDAALAASPENTISPDNIQPIFVATQPRHNRKQSHYRGHIDIVQDRNGDWQMHDDQQIKGPNGSKRPIWEFENCGAKLIMRLKKGDVITYCDREGARQYWRVFRLQFSNGYIGLGPVYLAGQQDKTPLIYKNASSLKAMGTVKCQQTPLGFKTAHT